MRKLINEVNKIRRTDTKKLIEKRVLEFKKLGAKGGGEIFSELCFCLLTANFDAERAIKIQKQIGNGFATLSQKRLAAKLKKLGYRYPNVRAKYIVEARAHLPHPPYLSHVGFPKSHIREWLVENVKGLGYKEASHFLRNTGHDNYAIIDFHIIDVLTRHNLIEKPKTLTASKYLEIEKILRKIAKKAGLNLAELDLYLWFTETGKVLK